MLEPSPFFDALSAPKKIHPPFRSTVFLVGWSVGRKILCKKNLHRIFQVCILGNLRSLGASPPTKNIKWATTRATGTMLTKVFWANYDDLSPPVGHLKNDGYLVRESSPTSPKHSCLINYRTICPECMFNYMVNDLLS